MLINEVGETIYCDVPGCCEEAYSMTQDVQEIEPVVGPDGKKWANWKLVGEVRERCEEHHLDPLTTRLDGSQYRGKVPDAETDGKLMMHVEYLRQVKGLDV